MLKPTNGAFALVRPGPVRPPAGRKSRRKTLTFSGAVSVKTLKTQGRSSVLGSKLTPQLRFRSEILKSTQCRAASQPGEGATASAPGWGFEAGQPVQGCVAGRGGF